MLVYYRLGRREEKKKEKDHHHHRYCWWWWFAFGCGGSVGGYVLLHSAVWFRSLEASASGGSDEDVGDQAGSLVLIFCILGIWHCCLWDWD